MTSFETKAYHFDLPEELIAAHPLKLRSDSRLLVVHRKDLKTEHRYIRDLPSLLPASTLIVANNTKVFPARLKGYREGSAGKIEFFLLKKCENKVWQGLMKAAARVMPGFKFIIQKEGKSITGEVLHRDQTTAGVFLTAKFSEDPVDAEMGEIPLPPYIVAKRGDATLAELEMYNTVFAKEPGSVAAPTAGRHFTGELIAQLRERGMEWEEITLHVGLGTFKPVTTNDIRDHQMHEEMSFVSQELGEKLLLAKREKRLVLAVGTTSTRTLEGRTGGEKDALSFQSGEKPIDLFIYPGSDHPWRMVDAILTNFHLPESTLLMMIASFLGDRPGLLKIYEAAIKEKYRFYSYGDAMLILP